LQKSFCAEYKKTRAKVIGWRPVPVDNSDIGKTARHTEPVIEQVFIGKSQDLKDELSFERSLYVIRKVVENEIRSSSLRQKASFYITNLSCRTIAYKGLLMPAQVDRFSRISSAMISRALSAWCIPAIALIRSRRGTGSALQVPGS